LTKQLT